MKKRFLSTIFVIFSFCCFPQSSSKVIDSLKKELIKVNGEKNKAKIYGDLTWYYSQISTDSALVYGDKAMSLAIKIGDSTLLAQTISDNGIVHYLKGDYDFSKDLFKKSLNIRNQLKDSGGIASLNYKIGNIFYKTTSLDSSMVYYLKALEYYENNNLDVIANSLKANIASIYMTLKNYQKALNYLNENLEFFKKNNQLEFTGNVLVNRASVHLFMKDTTQAITDLEKGIAISRKVNAYPTLGSAYNNLGTIYNDKKEYQFAKKYILESIKIRKKTNLGTELESSKLTLAGIYNALGDFEKAKPLLLNSLKVFEKENVNDKLLNVYLQLIPVYAYQSKPDSVSYYTDLYIKSKDVNLQEKMQSITSEIETKYQTEKIEKEILSQRADLAEKQLNLNRKNTQLVGLGILTIVLFVLGYLLYNQQKLKNQQLKKEGELKEALVKIETQNRLQEQRLRISRDLHDNIGAQLTFIISSVENLQFGFKMKNEKLTNKLSSISDFTKETIYELRDTIWAMNKNAITIEDLQARISNFIDKAAVTLKGIEFNFSIDDSILKTLEFKSVKGMNIYRIIQEAINNSIKYADASKVDIYITKIDNCLSFEIKDDGKGFNVEESISGNGLNNMRKRAQDIQAKIDIVSDINKGTSVILKV